MPKKYITARFIFVSLLTGLVLSPLPAQDVPDTGEAKMVAAIFSRALVDGETYQLLDSLCHNIGHRLSGSPGAAKAVEWTKKVMENYDFDNVRLQPVMVPHWERGDMEICRVVDSESAGTFDLNALAIGGSVATPDAGLTAPVIEVHSLEEVDEIGAERLRGKIVFYNRAFDQANIQTGAGYGGAVDQRAYGASRAAKYGAAAIVIRSVTSAFDDVPHTGALSYAGDSAKIPAAALGYQSANRLAELLRKEKTVNLFLKMNCRWLPDAQSYNVLGELRGSEKPAEIIVVGGHLDSWDVGQGAHDDGAGCMQS
ncbi:MAG: M28 family peptidase, partial [candidate division Zixibacteria bacterium]|nr:M28 family peptidase [candidate division Zixibacteria bacterium]